MLIVKNLSKKINATPILKGINVSIPRGQSTAIVGPSGSGKSTFLRCINYLETPTSGEIFIDGDKVHAKNLIKIRQKVGMVFQSFNLFPHLSVLENITYAPIKVLGQSKDKANKKAMDLLEQVGLTDKAYAHPSSLSGGQKQRVAIARALAMNPEIMLFDEPTSALDPNSAKEVFQIVKNLSHTGMTILLVTHETSLAQEFADRILFFDSGAIDKEGPPDDFSF